MIQIRNSVFETNSSSTHSICIPKKTKMTANFIDFGIGGYGWANEEVDAPSYLYTAILCAYDRDESMEKIAKLTDILNRNNIAYKFEKPKWEQWGSSLYLENGGIDHAWETQEFVEAVLNDEDMLLRYLSEGVVYTGNDNQDADYARCDIAFEDMYDWDKNSYEPNPYHDSENYDYFYKGN